MNIDNNNIVSYIQQALHFYDTKEYTKSEFIYVQIIQDTNFDFPELYIGYANTLLALCKYKQAIKNFKKCLRNKESYEAYFGIAIAYEKLGNIKQAIFYYELTIKNNPSFILAHNNLGNIYQNTRHYKKAKDLYLSALKFNPKQSTVLDNLGTLYQDLNKYEKAVKCHSLAIKYKSDNNIAYFNYALALLMLGNIKKGFKYYEYRLKLTDNITRVLPKDKLWKGNKIENKTLFIFVEQGFGDSIQFIRYIPYIKKYSKARIIFKCQNALVPLFKNFKEIDYFIEDHTLPPFDYYLPLLSSANALRKKMSFIPNQTPYLKYFYNKKNFIPDKDKKIRVGLSWKGSPKNSNNNSRSISLKYFEELFKMQQFQFYSLQKDNINEEELKKYNIIDLRTKLTDFNATANYIDNLDLVISVDTSIAHLALALDKPTWVLLSNVSDYRWSNKFKNSIWYPKAKIYKQEKTNTKWGKTIKQIKKDLIKML